MPRAARLRFDRAARCAVRLGPRARRRVPLRPRAPHREALSRGDADKPSLLLNPWSRRTTTHGGRAAARRPSVRSGARALGGAWLLGAAAQGRRRPRDDRGVRRLRLPCPTPPIVLANLVPDDDGVVRVPLAAARRARPASRSSSTIRPARTCAAHSCPRPPLAPRDLRLRLALDPARHATQQKSIAPLVAGRGARDRDLATAKVHLID